jgi:hypothetical protein
MALLIAVRRPRQGSGLGDANVERVRAARDVAMSDDLDEASDRFEQAAAAGTELSHQLGRGS